VPKRIHATVSESRSRRAQLAIASLSVASALGAASCCGEGCGSVLEISFSTSTPGQYVVTVIGDQNTVSSSTRLPDGACGRAACSGVTELGFSSCEGSKGTGPLQGIWTQDITAMIVEVTITRAGSEIAHETLRPSYEEECGDCRHASERIQLED